MRHIIRTGNNHSGVKKAFTIVELVVVIVVIGILATIVVVAYNGVQRSANDKSVLSDLDELDGIETQYGVIHHTSGLAWYSGSGVDPTLNFTPSSGDVVDVVTNSTDYCIRIYNPGSNSNTTLATAATKESTAGTCAALAPSAAAIAATTLGTPSGLTLTSGSGQLSASWTAAANAASYTLQYTTDCTFTSSISTISGITGTSQTITGLGTAGTAQKYYAQVTAVNGSQTSSPSATASNWTSGTYSTPTGVSASVPSSGVAELRWTAVAGATAYEVESSTNNSTFCPSTVQGVTGNTVYDMSLGHGVTKYYLRVRVIKSLGPPIVYSPNSIPSSGLTWAQP